MSHGYDRPNQKWTCGLESEGDPCSAGPTCRGRCPALGECVPIRDGDRWVCNRSEGRGGPCPDGPTPEGACCQVKRCRPQRSMRVFRGRWVRGAALFSIGALLMLLGSTGRNNLAAPGPLTSHHAQVIARANWSNRCATCHPGANDGPGDWAVAAWRGGTLAPQSTLCLDCHRDLAQPGAEPLLAHGLPEGTLERVQQIAFAEASLAAFSPLGEPARGASHGDELACAACHQEHHGAEHDLAAMIDARCQACHTERFASFADDHPDFGLWPTERRTRLAFNHASHSGEHFLKANREFDCRACHLSDASGDLTARPDYHAACAECHDADLRKSFGDGLAVIALPTIDRDSLSESGATITRWPTQAEGDFDGDLPPFTKLLLAADDRALAAMRALGEDFSFFDVDASSPDDLAAAADLVRSLQRLLDDLQEEGHGAIGYRLNRIRRNGAPVEEADYVARLPVELVDRIQTTWLGGQAPPEEFDAIEDRRTGGGWSVDDERLTLRYRPTGHDDPFLRAWLDAIVALPDELAGLRDASLAEFTRPGAPGGCVRCHSLEESATGALAINWSGRQRLEEPRGFTKFSHRPHLVQPELADCAHCHAIDPAADPTASYAGTDPHRFTSEFVALGKQACVACHKPHAAGDSCTQCHNYHVDAAAAGWRRAVQLNDQ